jgi:hypothetical protein
MAHQGAAAAAVFHPPGEQRVVQRNFRTICDVLFNTDIKSMEYAGAVLLISVLQSDPAYYLRYIQQRGDNFLEIMESEEQMAKESAYATSGALEENMDNDPIISGRSPRAIRPLEVIDMGERAAEQAAVQLYTNLMSFISSTRTSIVTLKQLMLQLNNRIQTQIMRVFAQPDGRRSRVYDNIDYIMTGHDNAPQEIFPKFSFNIICEKEPLLQTILVSGRENGMGKVLSTFVFRDLKNFFDTLPTGANYATLKIVEPSESNRLWQVKISVNKNDFVFFTIQIINVKPEFFDAADLLANFPVVPEPDAAGQRAQPIPQTYQLFENLCFSLYNKANSRDFNGFCSLSEGDEFFTKLLLLLGLDTFLLAGLLQRIRFFLTHLVDSQINIKKKYFIFGLYNLLYCYSQKEYTLETKVYRWLFDQPVMNVVGGQNNKNVFLYSMRLIQHVNNLCRNNAEGREITQVVMGGGKQYSMYQKALNNFIIHRQEFTLFTTQLADQILTRYPNILRQYPNLDILIRNLKHEIIKAAADLDAGVFHHDDALGSTECMTVCMLLQLAFKKLINFTVGDVDNQDTPYDIDIGNSCIGSSDPPAMLSSLRMGLNHPLLFYQGLDLVQHNPVTANALIATAAAAADNARIATAAADAAAPNAAAAGAAAAARFNAQVAAINLLITELDIELTGISSKICPFDLVKKGSMINYTIHIIEAVLLFGLGLAHPIEDLRGIYDNFIDNPDNLAQFISDFCMVTAEGFSSSLKGIFDILYTLFIVENFTNRTLVTQKINKELKRISICAQILYLHYSELAAAAAAAAANARAAAAAANARAAANPQDIGDDVEAAATAAAAADANVTAIDQMLNILKDMISYGYAGDLLSPADFNLIMRKYVEFMVKLCQLFDNPSLTFYCTPLPMDAGRQSTQTERFFMNLLENSNREPQSVPVVGDLLLQPQPPPPPPPAVDFTDIDDDNRNTILASLRCIVPAIRTIRQMDADLLAGLCQNAAYASYCDMKNKNNLRIIMSTAYQSFLFDITKRELIQQRNMTPGEIDKDNQHFHIGVTTATGLSDMFIHHPFFFVGLLAALAPCYRQEQNLLDISIEQFDGITINNPRQLQFMFWFITSVFGIKTKSAPKKLISLLRTYLNGIRELGLQNPIFGCNITFPDVPNPRPARIEGVVVVAGPNPLINDITLLCLAYDPYTINRAFDLYKNADDNLRGVAANSVFKIDNTIAIRINSLVLKQTVLSRLTVSFSKLPRGQAYVSQSSIFMSSVLNNFIAGFQLLLAGVVQVITVMSMLTLILQIVPNVLTENPYKPTPHDVSKFIDFQTEPQYYRNRWIIYLVTEIFNSGDNGKNLFDHMVLLVLLFRYLTILPTDAIQGIPIIYDVVNRTTQRCIRDARVLIASYQCTTVLEDAVAERQGIPVEVIQHEVQAAANDTHVQNRQINSAASHYTGRAALMRINAAVAADAADIRRGRSRNIAADDAAAALAALPVAQGNKRKRRGGGTICLRNPHSPKKPNNHTRKNKYKRNNKNKNKKHKSSPKYRKINPSSRSGSQSNKKKSKSKLPQKNVTFKRRRYNK